MKFAAIKPQRAWNAAATLWLVIVLAACLGLRIFMLVATDPIISPDSGGYMDLGRQIARLDLSLDLGVRTPVYPMLLALLGVDPLRVRLVQMALGLLITGIAYWLVWRVTRSGTLSALAGACYGLSLSQLYFEVNILTETLSTLGVVLGTALLLVILERLDRGRPVWAWVLGMGVVSALTGLIRPTFVFLPVFLAVIVLARIWVLRRGLRQAAVSVSLALLPAVIVIGGWSLYNYERLGYFGPSTISGYTLTDHSVAFIEYVPDKYAAIRETYLDLRRQEGTKYVNVWLGPGRIMRQTGLSFVQLSRVLSKMSLELFIHHPGLYAQSVGLSWLQFWNAFGGFRGVEPWEGAHERQDALLLGIVFRAMKYVFILLNLVFLCLAGIAIVAFVVRKGRAPGWVEQSAAIMAGLVLITALVSAMMQGGGFTTGGSNRYAMPVQPLIACSVFISLWMIWQCRKVNA